MDERRIAENLQLQSDQGDSSRYMDLQPSGEPLEDRWRLQQDDTASSWQPVEYARPPKQRPNWILPSLVGLALIGVLTYMAWIGITRLAPELASIGTDPVAVDENAATGSDDQQSSDGGESNEEAVAPAVQAATDTPLPAPTPVPTEAPLPTVEPTPVLVEQSIATVNNEFGVNARLDASTTSEVLRILEFGETTVVVDEREDANIEGNWLQVRTSEGALVWVASNFMDITTQLVPADPDTVVAPVTTEVDSTPLLDVRVTISSPAGLNARSAPDASANIVTILPNDRSYKAVSRSEDGQWIQVEIEDGSLVWIFLQLVIPTDDLQSLPVDGEEPPAAVAPTAVPTVAATEVSTETAEIAAPAVVTTTEDLTGTEGISATDSVSATAPADAGASISPTIVVSSTFGVNARAGTTTEDAVLVILEDGSENLILGRSADSQWLQIQLDDGRLAWVFAAAILTTADIASLPEAAPIPETNEPLTPTEAITGTQPITGTPSITGTGSLTGTGTTTPVLTAPEGAIAKISRLTGAKVRNAPGPDQAEIDTFRINTELKTVGRDDAGEWIAVELEDGSTGWVFGENVELNVELDALPILEAEST